MALAWTPNELFLSYKGVTVYRLYKDDNQNSPFTYQFCFSPDDSDTTDDQFDVRDLPKFSEICGAATNDYDESFRRVMEHAIDSGVLKMPEDGGGPCPHPCAGLEVCEDDDGVLYVLCSRCGRETRDLKNWVWENREDPE